MLEDQQLEVRLGASSTLSGMIRCSPAPLRARMVESINNKFTNMLLSHPLPKKQKSYLGGAASGVSTPTTGTSTPTPEHTKLIVTRPAAGLGLGALVQAFPYASPPPTWIPGVLTTVSGPFQILPHPLCNFEKPLNTICRSFRRQFAFPCSRDIRRMFPQRGDSKS